MMLTEVDFYPPDAPFGDPRIVVIGQLSPCLVPFGTSTEMPKLLHASPNSLKS